VFVSLFRAIAAALSSFYSRGEKDDVYLNLVMEFIPETIHRTLRNHTKANKLVPALSTKLYMYQYVEARMRMHARTGMWRSR